jgi:hypothetical protein
MDHQSSIFTVGSSRLGCSRRSQGSKVLSPMLVPLTKAMGLRAGRLVALVYMLCILPPTLSFALPGSHAVSPCLTDANHVPGMMHVHAQAPTAHLHADGHMHDHVMAHSDDRAIAGAHNYEQIPALAERSRQRIRNFYADFNDRLADVAFTAGDEFSVADITSVVTVDFQPRRPVSG